MWLFVENRYTVQKYGKNHIYTLGLMTIVFVSSFAIID